MKALAFALALALTLAFAPPAAAQSYIMANNRTEHLDLEPGSSLTILDPGGVANYPRAAQSRLYLHSSQPIRIYGWVDTHDGADRVEIYDGSWSHLVLKTAGEDNIDVVCPSGTAIIYFNASHWQQAPGYQLRATTVEGPLHKIHSWQAGGADSNSVQLSWADSSNATQWTVEYGIDEANLDQSVTTGTPSVTLTGLEHSREYFYRVLNNRADTNRLYMTLHSFKTRGIVEEEHEHDVSTGSLTIFTDDPCRRYILTGTTSDRHHYVHVEPGFRGTLVLRDLDMTFSGFTEYSVIRIAGAAQSNFDPVSNVSIILEGNNRITNTGCGRACLQVDQATTVRISAVDPWNNFSGTLCLLQTNSNGGAGIGGIIDDLINTEVTFTGHAPNGTPLRTAVGNIAISSGIVYAHGGGHSAGIGGGYGTWYDGMVLICGGIVDSRTRYHAAGIGSGCPNGHGVTSTYTQNSAIIVLPPAVISAAGAEAEGGSIPSLALAGSATIVYIGDESQPSITLQTDERTPGATIYADFSGNAVISRVCSMLADSSLLNVHRVPLGVTDDSGRLVIHALLQYATTFFTDAVSSVPGWEGTPFSPVTRNAVTSDCSITLPRSSQQMSIRIHADEPLYVGYTPAEARRICCVVRLEYRDAAPIENLSFGHPGPHFGPVAYYAADSVTPIPPPTSLRQGDVYFLHCPLVQGLPDGTYSGPLTLSGRGLATPLRVMVHQRVEPVRLFMICDSAQTEVTLPNGLTVSADGLYYDTLHLLGREAQDYDFLCDGSHLQLSLPSIDPHDSIIAYRVMMHPFLGDTSEAVACDSYTWYERELTATGLYTEPLRSQQGCDSTQALRLTIKYTGTGYDTVTLCPAQLPYPGNGYWVPVGTEEGTLQFRILTSGICDSMLEVYVHMLPEPEASIEIVSYSCLSGAYRLAAIHNGDSLSWPADTITVPSDAPSPYPVTVYSGECQAEASIPLEVPLFQLHAAISHSPERPTEGSPMVELSDASEGEVGAWEWSLQGEPIGDQPYASFRFPVEQDSVEVQLVVTHARHECLDTAHATILISREGALWIPNAFTPGQEENALFLATGRYIASYEIWIYDRIGRIVFHSDDILQGWDGTCHGIPLPQAAYAYRIDCSFTDNPSSIQTRKGTVTLLR